MNGSKHHTKYSDQIKWGEGIAYIHEMTPQLLESEVNSLQKKTSKFLCLQRIHTHLNFEFLGVCIHIIIRSKLYHKRLFRKKDNVLEEKEFNFDSKIL